jgi:ankyrin repeat protein
LFYAIHNNNIEMCKLLIDANININLQDKKLDTPLIWACCKKREIIIKLLLDKGADTTLRNEENKTAFDYSKDA